MNEPAPGEESAIDAEEPSPTPPEAEASAGAPGLTSTSPWPARLPWLVGLLFLVPYIVFAVSHPDALGNPDSVQNLAIARSLSEGGGFTTNTILQFYEHEPFGEDDTIRTPVTPWVLAALMRVMGPTPACIRVYNTAVLLALLAVVGRLVILLLAALPLEKRLSPWLEQGAWVVPLFLVFGSFTFVHAWDTNLFTLLVLTALWLFAEPKLPDRARPFLFGLVVALGTLNKVTFALFCVALAGLLTLAWLLVRGRAESRRVLTVFAGGALGILILAPWAVGNVREHGRIFPNKLLPMKWEATYPGVRLGVGVYQIQYDARVTFDDVVEGVGYGGMLRSHLSLAKSYLTNRSMGIPAVAFLALLGWGIVALLRKGNGVREGLRGLPPPLMLYGVFTLASLATSFFVSVFYWSYEPRYGYHTIVLFFLAIFLVARVLADRFEGKRRWISVGVLVALLVLGCPRSRRIPVIDAYRFLSHEYLPQERYRELGEWARRETPEDAVFMTGDVWPVFFTWDTRRRALWIPEWVKGTPEDVGVAQQEELIERLGVTHLAFDTLPTKFVPDRLAKFQPIIRKLEADGRIKERVERPGFLVLVLRPAGG